MRAGHDLQNDYNWGVSIANGTLTATHTGDTVDMRDCGPGIHVVMSGNAINSSQDVTVAVKVQTSPDDSTWTDLTGATMTTVGTPVTFSEVLSFYTRDARYVRAVATLAGTSVDVDLCVMLACHKASG